MTVDVIGTFHVTRHSIPHIKKSAAGSIVVMSSVGGRFGYPNRSAYCTAKMGLIGFAKTLSRELGQYSIRVNAIAPGAVGGDRIERVLQGRASAELKTLGGKSRGNEHPIAEALRRPQGYCRAAPVSDVGCRKINLRSGFAHRQ